MTCFTDPPQILDINKPSVDRHSIFKDRPQLLHIGQYIKDYHPDYSSPFSSQEGQRSPCVTHEQTEKEPWPDIGQNLSRDQEDSEKPETGGNNDEVKSGHQDLQECAALLNSLKACGKQKDLSRGIRIHADILKKGLLNDIYIGTALVRMYMNCGELAKGQEIFDKLPVRDVTSWTVLISGYAQHGLGNEALNCFRNMREEGLSPDTVTYVCVLKACSSVNAIEKGMKIHVELCRRGLSKGNMVLSNALVDMYAKCGALATAREVFDELPVRDIITWNVLIGGYAQHGLSNEALDCFEEMQEEGVSPDMVTFVCILKACSTMRAINKGEEIHAEVDRRGLLKQSVILGNALLDMYAKCDRLAKAQGLFDKLPARNVATWNVLIGGYAQQGLGNEALEWFQQMQREGRTPNEVTYLSVLKACGSVGDIEKGKEMHTEIQRQGLLQRHSMLGNALVDMYAKCGELAKAQKVFDDLPSRDVASWTSMIQGYAQQGIGNEALSCFEKLKGAGLSPDVFTFASVLQACASIGAVEKGEEVHAEVLRQGLLAQYIVLGTALVDMYSKCDALAKAQQVFDELPARDVTTWAALIGAYARQGLGHEALNLFGQMQNEGLPSNAAAYMGTLKACGSVGAIKKGIEVHAEVSKEGLLATDIELSNALVDMSAKCGELARAQEVFDGIPVRDGVSWNVLIAGYAQHGLGEEAFMSFARMQEEGFLLDAVTYVCVLKACGSIGTVKKGKEIHVEINQQGLLKKHLVLATALVDMYAKCRMIGLAQRVFDELPARDVVAWNSLITGYVQHGHGDRALECFERMQDEGISPDAITFDRALKACGSIRAPDKGKQIHVYVNGRQGYLEKHNELGAALVEMYATCGMLARAQEALDELPGRDVGMWTELMAGYTQHGHYDEALNCFRRLQDEGISPNAGTFIFALKACGSIGLADNGESIHMELRRQGLRDRSIALGTVLVDMYAKCGVLQRACEVFDRLPLQDVVAWTALIAGYAQLGNVDWAFALHRNMIKESIQPNVVTFAVLLTACSHGGLVEGGQLLFDTMAASFCITPRSEHFTGVVDLLSRAGHLDKAIAVVEKVADSSDSLLLWMALLGARRNGMHVELGRWFFEHAPYLDAKHSGAFVRMSNTYAEDG